MQPKVDVDCMPLNFRRDIISNELLNWESHYLYLSPPPQSTFSLANPPFATPTNGNLNPVNPSLSAHVRSATPPAPNTTTNLNGLPDPNLQSRNNELPRRSVAE